MLENAISADRLVESPVFVLSTMRSGSTLLRVLLNSHSMIRSPHELHLQTLGVEFTGFNTELAVKHLGLDKQELEHLLWDRVLHRELVHSGKQIIAEKTPANALGWRRLRECWPQARFIFLLRHPAAVVASLLKIAGGSADQRERFVKMTAEHVQGLDEARRELPGLTVRYEELVAGPAEVTKEICAFLDVPWEPGMLAYGEQEHGAFEAFIGDFTEKIKSGRIQRADPLPPAEDVPAELRDICRSWGYLT